jgi:hypothetical protein
VGQNLDEFNATEGWFRDVVDRMPYLSLYFIGP